MPRRTKADRPGAVTAPNRRVEASGRQLAYRSIGEGVPLLLCNRFRGTMDSWDPAFLDALAGHGIRVIVFDHSGLGLSTGERSYNPLEMVEDLRDLSGALGLGPVAVGGWSLGGMVAQAALARIPALLSHVVLIGTAPPGPSARQAEQLFYDIATKPECSLEDEAVLFFGDRSGKGLEAARRSAERLVLREAGRSAEVPWEWAAAQLGDAPRQPLFPSDAVLAALRTTGIPILHVGGDHDIGYPVENWYALSQQLPTLQVITLPGTGNAPHHHHPGPVAAHISVFLRGGKG
ncbi:alpha/beta fold hydrolase [Pararoseomonas indoligenes]|uniref:Alpha/beta hydrolase n=1 Tax=Roseomonas indoligenes TaxID=2820811 RepID=A0A940N200_9PROT|nr:alpha/beta hydrolase [Pararoseomonas indoligenes]MBP0495099.1 alpha/beta hydrolase [Pararoseomonas indoligenes]